MKTFIFLLLSILLIDPALFQGKWKLSHSDAFLSLLQSERFEMESDENQKKMTETIQFVLDHTIYEFKGDSVYFTDAGPGLTREKSGKWILKGDTLMILESGKVKLHRFLMVKLDENEFAWKFIHLNQLGDNKGGTYFFSKVD